jgi:uncharacterized protein YidB (DUF937 family)
MRNNMMTKNRTKHFLVALGATAGIAAGGIIGANVASAQTDDGTVVEELPLQVDQPADEVGVQDATDVDHPQRRGCGGRGTGAAAEAIGITPEELREALDGGSTIADVAEANGVDPASVVEALVSNAQERLDELVADGTLTRAEADERLAERTERAEDRVFGTGDEGESGN